MAEGFLRLLAMDRARSGRWGAVRCWTGAVVDAVVRGSLARVRLSSTAILEVFSSVVADVRFGCRSLVRHPLFAVTTTLTIAIGIGANAAIFTIVKGFVLTPLPYENPDELLALRNANPALGWDRMDVSYADAWDWRERSVTLRDIAVVNDDAFSLAGGDGPELVPALRVTPNFLGVLGIEPVLGRDFRPDEIGQGRDDLVVITDGFWQRHFARDPGALGSTLILDGRPVTVIGVTGSDFLYYDGRPDVLRPWAFLMTEAPRNAHSADAVARMLPGVHIDAVREDLTRISEQLASEHEENVGWRPVVAPLQSDVAGEIALNAAAVFMVAVGFVLLMACVNVANLLLSRASTRSREVAIRGALGAGRGRLVRQLLTESSLIAGAGGALGFLGAVWGSRAIVAGFPSTVPPVFNFEVDPQVLTYTAVVTVGAAIVFGLAPALTTTRSGLGAAVGRHPSTTGRFGSTLVVVQTALALVLLVGGGLLMRSVSGMRSQDFGFDAENVLTARLAPPVEKYSDRTLSEAYWRDVTDRIRRLPEVEKVGTTQSHPLMGSNWARAVQIAGREVSESSPRTVRLTFASDGLFEALRFRMLEGRAFTDRDDVSARPVGIVNEAFVDRYLGSHDDPLQQTLIMPEGAEVSVIGVVGNVVERDIDAPPEPALYLPIAQSDIRTRSLVIQTSRDPTEIFAAVRAAVWSVDASIPISEVYTMQAIIDDRVGGFTVIGNVMAIFAVLSLILGAVGIYGVTAYSADQRRTEIGVRLALGAAHSEVVSMVVREGGRRTMLGILIGALLAVALGRGLSGILVGVSPTDPFTFATVLLLLATVSFGGIYLPARRLSRLDPVRALSAE